VPGAALWVTHSTCLNDHIEVKMQRIVTAWLMSLMGHSRPMTHDRAMCALPPIATIDEGGWHVR
jgi:hypothetical protein